MLFYSKCSCVLFSTGLFEHLKKTYEGNKICTSLGGTDKKACVLNHGLLE